MFARSRVRPGVTSYEGITAAGGLTHALQALHAGTTDSRLTTILQTQFPSALDTVIAQIIAQAHGAKDGAEQINDNLFATGDLITDRWGYDPGLQSDWALYVVHYIPVPTSWYTKLIELTGEHDPVPDDIIRSIAAITNLIGSPAIISPTITGAPSVGLRDDLPAAIKQAKVRFTFLIHDAKQGRAPDWFQAAYDTAQSLGINLQQWGENAGLIIAGVFRNVIGKP